MVGLNQRSDVEVAEVSNLPDQFDLIPVSDDGVRAISGYFGCKAETDAPVRVTADQYQEFNEYIYGYAKERGKAFSIQMRRGFLGQRHADQSDLDLPSDPTLPQELTERLSFGRTVHMKDHNFTVSVGRYRRPSDGRLFKVTKSRHAPARSRGLSLGTLSYYRNTVDKYEASFESSGRGVRMHDMEGNLLVGPDTEVHRTVSMDPCWIYCTTAVDRGFKSDQSPWLDGNHTATPIVVTENHFARMLGAGFGVWSKPRIRQVYSCLESVEKLRYTMNGVMVLHGPVRYMSASERNLHLASLSREGSPIEVHENLFTKNDEFSWEREYRFAIWGWGPPLQPHVVMPLDGELLECYGAALPLPVYGG